MEVKKSQETDITSEPVERQQVIPSNLARTSFHKFPSAFGNLSQVVLVTEVKLVHRLYSMWKKMQH